ncbi:MAG TPA: TIGR03621 family F420-dependent LLM class oxidoreductase [Candidatus Limnocylindria bacterium]|nr:TIGR03621 family F420-dependent LLM class oxidoreductase [Candidatus Limnocylindria bacterium]
MHPFRFAVHEAYAPSGEAWLAFARRAEDLGYDTLLVPDHLGNQLSPISALAAAAAVTTRLRIGPYVFANDFRHPLVMAREAASLDVLSGGRLELGIGAGWRTSDYRQLGLPYEAPGRRVDRLVEALPLITRLLSGEEVTHAGMHYRLGAARVAPRPVQRPRPPLHIGAGGPRMLRLAARHAEIVGLIPQFTAGGRPQLRDLGEEALARKIDVVRAAAGERFWNLELSIFCADAGMVGGTGHGLAGSAFAAVKDLLTAPVASPYLLYGRLTPLREELERRRDRLGISHYAIPGHAMEEMAPLVGAMAGR